MDLTTIQKPAMLIYERMLCISFIIYDILS